MSSKPSGNTTTTTNAAPWASLQPYLQNLYASGQNLATNNPITAYPGETQAPLNPTQLQAMNLQSQRALSGSPVTNAAQQQNFNTESGNYLGAGNPYFGNMINQIAEQVNPQVASGFEAGGRLGSGAQANAFESAMTNTAGNLAYQNYNAERQRQTQAGALAPALANQDYTDISALSGVGAQQQGQQQAYLNEAQQKYLANMQGPWQTAQNFGGILGGINVPASSTQSQPYFTNPTANVLGTGLGLAALAGSSPTATSSGTGVLGLVNNLFGSSGGTGK